MLNYLLALLFSWVTFTTPVGAPPFDPEVYFRERWTAPINKDAFNDSYVVINLFKDAQYIGIVKAHEDGLFWRGILRNYKNSYWVISCYPPTGDCWLKVTGTMGCYMAYRWEDYFRIVQFRDKAQCQF